MKIFKNMSEDRKETILYIIEAALILGLVLGMIWVYDNMDSLVG